MEQVQGSALVSRQGAERAGAGHRSRLALLALVLYTVWAHVWEMMGEEQMWLKGRRNASKSARNAPSQHPYLVAVVFEQGSNASSAPQ